MRKKFEKQRKKRKSEKDEIRDKLFNDYLRIICKNNILIM